MINDKYLIIFNHTIDAKFETGLSINHNFPVQAKTVLKYKTYQILIHGAPHQPRSQKTFVAVLKSTNNISVNISSSQYVSKYVVQYAVYFDQAITK